MLTMQTAVVNKPSAKRQIISGMTTSKYKGKSLNPNTFNELINTTCLMKIIFSMHFEFGADFAGSAMKARAKGGNIDFLLKMKQLIDMAARTLKIATRKSPLALWQANFVKDRLEAMHPQLQVELVPMSTQGDKILDTPLAKVGGKGLFVKELETAMLEGRADIAVHSMKDVPVEFPEGLGLHTICEREDPRDAFVSNRFKAIAELPQGAVVGTSSLRRQCQLRAARPDLVIRDLRGNVNTRLAKLDAGEYAAIILAAAGLKRLEMVQRITAFIEPEQSLPANGQGAVGIECCLDDVELHDLLAPLEHAETRARVLTERAMNRALQGGCRVPIGAYALVEGEQIWLRGLVGSPDGTQVIRDEIRGPLADSAALGEQLAQRLLAAGADEILAEIYRA